jgi:hypothetical protein
VAQRTWQKIKDVWEVITLVPAALFMIFFMIKPWENPVDTEATDAKD